MKLFGDRHKKLNLFFQKMGSILSSDCGLDPLEAQQLQAETGFSKANIKRLHHRFDHLDKEKKGYLTKKDLMAIPEVFKFEFFPQLNYICSSIIRSNK